MRIRDSDAEIGEPRKARSAGMGTDHERQSELARSLFAERDLDRVLQRVLTAAVELTGARYAALGIIDASGTGLARFVTAGLDETQRREIGDPPCGHGVLGVLIRDPRCLRLADIGKHPCSYGFPAGHPPMRSFLGVPILIGGEAFANLYLADKEAADAFTAEDEQVASTLAEWAAIAIEHVRRHAGVREERDQLAQRVEIFETTEATSHALAGVVGIDRVLELVVKRARALVDARVMVLALQEGGELVVRALSGESEQPLLGLRVPIEGGGLPILASAVGARAAMTMPLEFCGRCVGVLSAFDRLKGGPEFGAEDQRLMGALAFNAAAAVATAQDVAAQGLRRSIQAAELERSRWARELHDQTLQDLAALRILLAGALRTPERADVDHALEQAIEQVRFSVGALRGLITELRPASLDELGPGPALRALVARSAATSGLEIELAADLADEAGRAPTRHTPELEGTIYRLVQEALTNITKHAVATRVRIEITEDAECVHVRVGDDGAGFDAARGSAGLGLLGMRERVALVAGTLTIESRAGEGTTVIARLPAARRPPNG